MANSQGLTKQTVFAKQAGLAAPSTTGATTGGRIMRRTSAVFTRNVDTYESNEIVSHQQSTGANAGIVKTTGKLDCLISPLTQSLQFASLLRKDFVSAVAPMSVTATIGTVSAGLNALSRAAGSWLTDGLKVGDVIRLSGGTLNAANVGNNMLVVDIASATACTVKCLSSTPLVAQSAIASVTATVIGKKTYAPTSGHTNDYWTVEECYTDLSKFEQFIDCKIGKADITLPATGNATVSFDIPGLARTRTTTATVTSPAAETTTNVLTAVNGAVVVSVITNGVATPVVTPITGATITIDGHIQPGEAEVGSNGIGDHIRGEIGVSGQFTAKFSGTTLQAAYDNQNLVTLVLAITDSGNPAADFVSFTIPQCKLFGDAPDDGEAKEIVRTYPFTAQIPSALVGGANLAHLQTIISVTDSQAA